MSLRRDYARASALLGRRTVLKYAALGALGVGVATLTGCKDGETVTTKALSAWVSGKWNVTVDGQSVTINVSEDGSFTVEGNNTDYQLKPGTWTVTGDRVVVNMGQKQFQGSSVPGEVGETETATIPWRGANSEADRQFDVPVEWNSDTNTLTISGGKAGSQGSGTGQEILIVATRG